MVTEEAVRRCSAKLVLVHIQQGGNICGGVSFLINIVSGLQFSWNLCEVFNNFFNI